MSNIKTITGIEYCCYLKELVWGRVTNVNVVILLISTRIFCLTRNFETNVFALICLCYILMWNMFNCILVNILKDDSLPYCNKKINLKTCQILFSSKSSLPNLSFAVQLIIACPWNWFYSLELQRTVFNIVFTVIPMQICNIEKLIAWLTVVYLESF